MESSHRMENHLSRNIIATVSVSSNSLQTLPLPLFGFLARGVYLVPPLTFPSELRHCGTFKVVKPYPLLDLGFFPAVSQILDCPGLRFRQARTLQASQLVRARTFLTGYLRACAILSSTIWFSIVFHKRHHWYTIALPFLSFVSPLWYILIIIYKTK